MPAAKKAAAKPTGRTTARKANNLQALPTLKPNRFQAFDSAADEWQDEPIGFELDGKLWLCDGSPNSTALVMLRNIGTANSMDFVAACVTDKDGWAEHLAANPLPGHLLRGIAGFLIQAYTGALTGK